MAENKRLEQLYEQGVKLFIGNMPATPEMVERLISGRKKAYTPKFSYDEIGNLDEIRY